MTVPALDTFPAHRLNVRVADLSDFQHRYEQAVPLLPATEVDAMVERGASWTEMLGYIDSVAANGFLIYWRSDIHRMMRLAGDKARCFAYLMGNHTIAERMFRHDPRVMLYAPLRTAIWDTPTAPHGSASTNRAATSPASASPRSPKWGSNWTESSRHCWRSSMSKCPQACADQPPLSPASRPSQPAPRVAGWGNQRLCGRAPADPMPTFPHIRVLRPNGR